MNAPDGAIIIRNSYNGAQNNNTVFEIGGYKLSLSYLRKIVLEIGTEPQEGTSGNGWFRYKGLVASEGQIIAEIKRRKAAAHTEKLGDSHRDDLEVFASQMDLPTLDENYGIPEVPMAVQGVMSIPMATSYDLKFSDRIVQSDELDHSDFSGPEYITSISVANLPDKKYSLLANTEESNNGDKSKQTAGNDRRIAEDFILNYLKPFLKTIQKKYSCDYETALSIYLDRLSEFIEGEDEHSKNITIQAIYDYLASHISQDSILQAKISSLRKSVRLPAFSGLAADSDSVDRDAPVPLRSLVTPVGGDDGIEPDSYTRYYKPTENPTTQVHPGNPEEEVSVLAEIQSLRSKYTITQRAKYENLKNGIHPLVLTQAQSEMLKRYTTLFDSMREHGLPRRNSRGDHYKQLENQLTSSQKILLARARGVRSELNDDSNISILEHISPEDMDLLLHYDIYDTGRSFLSSEFLYNDVPVIQRPLFGSLVFVAEVGDKVIRLAQWLRKR